MKNEGIEDILIDRSHENNNAKKKKKVIVLVIVVILLLLASGAYGFYKYTYSINNSNKKLFMRNLGNNNLKSALNVDNYRIIASRLLEESSTTNTDFTVQSTMPESPFLKEELANVDLSKFDLKATTKLDNINQNYFTNFFLNYSGNTIFDLKLQLKNQTAYAYSDEIVTSYVGLKYEDFEKYLGIRFSMNDIRKIRKSEKIDFPEEEKKKCVENYIEYIFNMIPEEKFTIQNNIALEKASGTVDVTAYTLTLNRKDFKDITIAALTRLKNDDDLLKRYLSETEVYVDEMQDSIRTINPQDESEINENTELVYTIEGVETTPENTINPDDLINTEAAGGLLPDVLNGDGNEEEQTNQNNQNDSNGGTSAQIISYDDSSTQQVQTQQEPTVETITIGPNGEITTGVQGVTNTLETSLDITPETYVPVLVAPQKKVKRIPQSTMEMIKVFTGRKSTLSIPEVKNYIDDVITKINNLDGDGDFKFTIYKNAQNTEKITIVLPNDNTIELEFTYVSNQEDKVKISYLYSGNNNFIKYLLDEEEQEYPTVVEAEGENIDQEKRNGISVSVDNIKNNSSSILDITYDFIENNEINKRISTNIKTEGTKDSKTLSNTILINYSTNGGKVVYSIDANTKFENEVEIEELTTANSMLLEDLGDQVETTIQAIKDRIREVFNEKKNNTTFIDANINTNVIDDNISRDEARAIVIDRVSKMMGDAIQREEEFTIKNLEGLTITGYDVSCNVTEKQAIVVINSYTFVINEKFEITDV